MPEPRRIQTPDGAIHEFPADATDAEISAALNPSTPAQGGWSGALAAGKQFIENAPELTVGRAVLNNLPAVGATIGAAVASPGMVTTPAGAALGGAAGEAAQQLLDRARGKPVPSTSLEAAKDIGLSGAGQGALQALTEGASLYGPPLVKAAAGRVMQSALKPSSAIKSVLKDVRAGVPVPKVVQTLLDEGVNVSRGGIAKLNDIIGGLNEEVQTAVKGLTGTTEKTTVAAHMAPTAYQLAKQGAPTEDLKAFGSVVEDFLNHPMYQGAMTNSEMQAMKQATYRGIDYSKMGNAAVEARKALGHGLKEEIEQNAAAQGAVDIRALNAREGKAIEAMDAVVKRVAQSGNNNPMGLAALAHGKTAFLSMLVDRSPVVKSYIARGLYTPAASILGISPHLLRSLVVATSTLQDESNGP